MKKMNMKNRTEKAFKVVNALKDNAQFLQENGNDIEFIAELETSVQNQDELEKELVQLKETLNAKKWVYKKQKELTLELVKNAKEVLKKEVSKKQKHEQKQQHEQPVEPEVPEQPEQPEQPEEKQEPEVKQETVKTEVKPQKKKLKQKTEATEEKQTPEIVEETEEPK